MSSRKTTECVVLAAMPSICYYKFAQKDHAESYFQSLFLCFKLTHLITLFTDMAVLSRCQTAAGDGCGRSFINKSTPGLCAKCSLLSTLVAGSDDLENAKACFEIDCFASCFNTTYYL